MHFNALPAYGYGAREVWALAAPLRVAFSHAEASTDQAGASSDEDDQEVRSHQRMVSIASHAMRQIEALERSLQPVE